MAASRENSYLHSGKSSSTSSSPQHHKTTFNNANYRHSNLVSNDHRKSNSTSSLTSNHIHKINTEHKSSANKSKPPDSSANGRIVITANHRDSDTTSFRSSLSLYNKSSNYCENPATTSPTSSSSKPSSTAEVFARSGIHREQQKDTSSPVLTSSTFDLIKYSSDLSRQQQHNSHVDLSGANQLSPPSSYCPSSSPIPVLTRNSVKVQPSAPSSASYSCRSQQHHRQLSTSSKSASSPSRPPSLISGYHDDINSIFQLYKPSSLTENCLQSSSPTPTPPSPPPPIAKPTATKFQQSTNGWSTGGVDSNNHNGPTNDPSNVATTSTAAASIYTKLKQSLDHDCALDLHNNNGDSHCNLVVTKKTNPAITPTSSISPGLAITLTSALTNCATSINNQANNNNNKPGSQSTSPMPASISIGNEPLAQLLFTLKEQNKSLIREIEDLRIKLEDAEGDLKLVRCQMRSMSKQMDTVVVESSRDRMIDENILNELEFYKDKVLLLERDCQSLLDEKEDLILTKGDLQLKNQRLNEQLIGMMHNLSDRSENFQDTNSLLFDVDSLFLENRYLKEKIKNEEDERRLLLSRLSKYKELIEQHPRNDSALASSSHKKKPHFINNANCSTSDTSIDAALNTVQLPDGRMVNTRDVERLISSESIHSMEVNKSNQMYLWNLLVALFGELQSKNMNLVHARKTNHFLGKHCEELESTIRPPFESDNSLDRAPGKQHYRVKSPMLSGAESISSRSSPTNMANASNTVNVPNQHRPDAHHAHHNRHILDNGPSRQPETDGNISSSATATTLTTAKETSEEENDDEDVSSTAISTPSTARRSLSIEQHLQALQNDALDLPSSKQPQPNPTTFNSIHHHSHQQGLGGSGNSGSSGASAHSSNHLFDFKRDFDKHKAPTKLY